MLHCICKNIKSVITTVLQIYVHLMSKISWKILLRAGILSFKKLIGSWYSILRFPQSSSCKADNFNRKFNVQFCAEKFSIGSFTGS